MFDKTSVAHRIAVSLGLLAVIAAGLYPATEARAGSAFAGVELASHRAFYSMALSPQSRGGTIESVEGVMTMSLEKTCDGWIFTQDMNALFAIQDGAVIRQSAAFTSFESFAGDSYQFASRVKTDAEQDEVRGEAKVDSDGTGRALYRKPSEIEIELPAGTLFPVSHTAWLIAEAKAGHRQASRVVFTGSDELHPELINAFIGEASDADVGDVEAEGGLMERPGWPLTMAFYELNSETGLPTLEMTALQLDNGVAPWLIMNFGEFATVMKAERVEPLPAPSC